MKITKLATGAVLVIMAIVVMFQYKFDSFIQALLGYADLGATASILVAIALLISGAIYIICNSSTSVLPPIISFVILTLGGIMGIFNATRFPGLMLWSWAAIAIGLIMAIITIVLDYFFEPAVDKYGNSYSNSYYDNDSQPYPNKPAANNQFNHANNPNSAENYANNQPVNNPNNYQPQNSPMNNYQSDPQNQMPPQANPNSNYQPPYNYNNYSSNTPNEAPSEATPYSSYNGETNNNQYVPDSNSTVTPPPVMGPPYTSDPSASPYNPANQPHNDYTESNNQFAQTNYQPNNPYPTEPPTTANNPNNPAQGYPNQAMPNSPINNNQSQYAPNNNTSYNSANPEPPRSYKRQFKAAGRKGHKVPNNYRYNSKN